MVAWQQACPQTVQRWRVSCPSTSKGRRHWGGQRGPVWVSQERWGGRRRSGALQARRTRTTRRLACPQPLPSSSASALLPSPFSERSLALAVFLRTLRLAGSSSGSTRRHRRCTAGRPQDAEVRSSSFSLARCLLPDRLWPKCAMLLCAQGCWLRRRFRPPRVQPVQLRTNSAALARLSYLCLHRTHSLLAPATPLAERNPLP